MIKDDFNFTFDDSEFPVSIEEFAAYLDGNLSDDEMQRVSSVIENDEEMQGVMDGMEQTEITLAEYGQEDMQVPEEIKKDFFSLPNVSKNNLEKHISNGFYKVAALAPSHENGSFANKNITRTPPRVLTDIKSVDNEPHNTQNIEDRQ